jgi:hypothetical protein
MISVRVARSPQQEYKIPFSLEALYSIPHRARHNPQNPAGLLSCLSPGDLQNPNSTISMTPLYIPPHRVQKVECHKRMTLLCLLLETICPTDSVRCVCVPRAPRATSPSIKIPRLPYYLSATLLTHCQIPEIVVPRIRVLVLFRFPKSETISMHDRFSRGAVVKRRKRYCTMSVFVREN